MSLQTIAWIRVAFWFSLVCVVVLSLIPTQQLPDQVSQVWDKSQHVAGFVGLTVLGLMGYPGRFKRVCFGLLVAGALIELAQHATGWRHGDLEDLFADLIGIVAGAALWLLTKRLNP